MSSSQSPSTCKPHLLRRAGRLSECHSGVSKVRESTVFRKQTVTALWGCAYRTMGSNTHVMLITCLSGRSYLAPRDSSVGELRLRTFVTAITARLKLQACNLQRRFYFYNCKNMRRFSVFGPFTWSDFLSLCERNPLWTPLNPTSKRFFF